MARKRSSRRRRRGGLFGRRRKAPRRARRIVRAVRSRARRASRGFARAFTRRRRRGGGGLFGSRGSLPSRVLGNAGAVLRAVLPLIAGAAAGMFVVRFLPPRAQGNPWAAGAIGAGVGLVVGSQSKRLPLLPAGTWKLVALGMVADGVMRALSNVNLPGVGARPGRGLLADARRGRGAHGLSDDPHRAVGRLVG